MPKIVISYRRSDTDVFAGRVRDRIAGRFGDQSVFMDIDDIPFGKDFRVHIQGALSQSDVVVVVIGRRWLGAVKRGAARINEDTDPVRIEVEVALTKGIPIIPILVGDTNMPSASQLPESIRDFSYINAASVDTGRDFHRDMDRVIQSLTEITTKSGATINPTDQERNTRTASITTGSRRRFAVLAGVACLCVAAIAATTWHFRTVLFSVVDARYAARLPAGDGQPPGSGVASTASTSASQPPASDDPRSAPGTSVAPAKPSMADERATIAATPAPESPGPTDPPSHLVTPSAPDGAKPASGAPTEPEVLTAPSVPGLASAASTITTSPTQPADGTSSADQQARSSAPAQPQGTSDPLPPAVASAGIEVASPSDPASIVSKPPAAPRVPDDSPPPASRPAASDNPTPSDQLAIIVRPQVQAFPRTAASDTVQAFYSALGRGDGKAAAALLIPEKRTGRLSSDAMTSFYSRLMEPLQLVSVVQIDESKYQVAYTFRANPKEACDGSAIVTTERRGGRPLIKLIEVKGRC